MRKSPRPLSAGRRSGQDQQDSAQEAQAVLAALRAENAQLQQRVRSPRDIHSAPGRSQVGLGVVR